MERSVECWGMRCGSPQTFPPDSSEIIGITSGGYQGDCAGSSSADLWSFECQFCARRSGDSHRREKMGEYSFGTSESVDWGVPAGNFERGI